LLPAESYLPRTSAKDTHREFRNHNWSILKEATLQLIDYRLSTHCEKWYKDGWETHKRILSNVDYIQDPSEVNGLSKGIFAEVLFYQACMQSGVSCRPTDGLEDGWGADFSIGKGKEVRFLDITVNCDSKSITRKNRNSSFPTFMSPWFVGVDSLFEPKKKQYYPSYVETYLMTGAFEGNDYLRKLVDMNYEVLDLLKRDVWRGLPPHKKLFSRKEFSFDNPQPTYINNFEGGLLILREHLGRKKRRKFKLF
jgi:hypothetical protein